MKHFIHHSLIAVFILCIICSSIAPANAMEASKKYKTGWKNGQVIKTTYGYRGGRSRGKYVISKDLYVSEKVITDKWVKNVTDWNESKSVINLSYSNSTTISASGSVDIVKSLGLKATISVSKSTSAGGAHKVDPKKGKQACLAIKCDFVQVTYRHVTYKNGKQTGSTTKTVLVPLPNTAVYYVRYKN